MNAVKKTATRPILLKKHAISIIFEITLIAGTSKKVLISGKGNTCYYHSPLYILNTNYCTVKQEST